MVHCIVMNQSGAPAALCTETFGEHVDDPIELLVSKVSVRPGRTDELEEFGFIPVFGGSRGDDLLG